MRRDRYFDVLTLLTGAFCLPLAAGGCVEGDESRARVELLVNAGDVEAHPIFTDASLEELYIALIHCAPLPREFRAVLDGRK